MKKYTSLRKGFTLVELMIVIAIIGILAAVLYPGFNGFMEGARDSARTTSIKNYSTALLAYNQDNSAFPKTDKSDNSGTNTSFCIEDLFNNHLKSYMSKGIEKDPKNGNGVSVAANLNCSAKWGYGYKGLKLNGETTVNGNSYVLAAKMEKWSNANYNAAGTSWANAAPAFNALDTREKVITLTKWSPELKALEKKPNDTYYVVAN